MKKFVVRMRSLKTMITPIIMVASDSRWLVIGYTRIPHNFYLYLPGWTKVSFEKNSTKVYPNQILSIQMQWTMTSHSITYKTQSLYFMKHLKNIKRVQKLIMAKEWKKQRDWKRWTKRSIVDLKNPSRRIH